MIIFILSTIATCILVYYLLLSVWYSVLMIEAYPEVLNRFHEVKYGNVHKLINENCLVPITIVTPVFNEADGLMEMIYSVLNSDYKNIKLILVNDGSTDNTMEILKRELLLYEVPKVIREIIKTELVRHCYQSQRFPNITVLDKEHCPANCAADSLNAGLNACQTPIILSVDADTILEPDALTRILFTILSTPHCVVVSGSVYVLNDNKVEKGKLLTHQLPRHFIGAVQAVEYLRSFLYGRAGLNVLQGALCYPGAFSLFETQILREVNGYDTINFSYDAEITTKIHHYMRENKYPYNMNHSPNSFSWTDAPNTLKSYWRQRNFWQRGMYRQIRLHSKMLFNPKYGVVGLLSWPAYIFYDVFGPVVEFISFILLILFFYLGILDFTMFLWFIVLAWGFICLVSVAMLFLNQISFNKYNQKGDFFKVIGLVTVEMLGFRQFRGLCCTVASFQYFFNRIRGKEI